MIGAPLVDVAVVVVVVVVVVAAAAAAAAAPTVSVRCTDCQRHPESLALLFRPPPMSMFFRL